MFIDNTNTMQHMYALNKYLTTINHFNVSPTTNWHQ